MLEVYEEKFGANLPKHELPSAFNMSHQDLDAFRRTAYPQEHPLPAADPLESEEFLNTLTMRTGSYDTTALKTFIRANAAAIAKAQEGKS